MPDPLARAKLGELAQSAANVVGFADIYDFGIRHPIGLQNTEADSGIAIFEPAATTPIEKARIAVFGPGDDINSANIRAWIGVAYILKRDPAREAIGSES